MRMVTQYNLHHELIYNKVAKVRNGISYRALDSLKATSKSNE